MPRKPTRRPSDPRTTVLFRAGNTPSNPQDLFRRVFWKSDFLAGEAHSFWQEVRRAEPMGLPIQAWKDWVLSRRTRAAQFYNMIPGLVGAGTIELRESKLHVRSGFI